MKGSLAEKIHEELTVLELRDRIAAACAQAKGMELAVLNVRNVSDLADYFVIVSGRSDRQVQGIGNRILDAAAQHGVYPISVEGFDTGHWILLDFGEIVVHVFYEATRAHYDLEHLWSRAEQVELQP